MLPLNLTVTGSIWKDLISLSPNTTQKYPSYHLLYPIPLAFVVLLVRHTLEKYLFAPIGIAVGIKHTKPKPPPSNWVLEKSYSYSKKWNHEQIQGLAKQSDMSERQVEIWLKLRNRQNRSSTLTKFGECSWKCFYYTCSFLFGVVVIWDKPWGWDLNECWTGYPHLSLTDDVWWYQIIAMSFYWSSIISHFFDVKRKDFWEMFVHHLITIALMYLSWLANTLRISCIVLVVHDCADIFLEAGKMSKYLGYQKVVDVLSVVFVVVWIVTRLGLFPFWIIKHFTVDAPKIVPMFTGYYIFNGLVYLIFVLHCFWTYLILKFVVKAFAAGYAAKDERSSSEDSSSEQ